MKPQQLTIITVIVVRLAGLGFYFFNRNQNQTPAAQFDGTLDLTNQPSLGSDDAPVTIVAFEDFKCPHCARTWWVTKEDG